MVTLELTGLNTSPFWALCLHNRGQQVASSASPSAPTAQRPWHLAVAAQPASTGAAAVMYSEADL